MDFNKKKKKKRRKFVRICPSLIYLLVQLQIKLFKLIDIFSVSAKSWGFSIFSNEYFYLGLIRKQQAFKKKWFFQFQVYLDIPLNSKR